MTREWGGRRAQRLRRLVLDVYGDVCHLCGRRGADTADHLVPRSRGGTDTLDNLRPAHFRCNARRGDRPAPGQGARVVVVTGPPAAGKSTWVNDTAAAEDVVIDLDRIARALVPSAGAGIEPPPHVRHVAIGARADALERAAALREQVTVFLIHALPSLDQLDDYRARGWQIVTIDPGADVVLPRLSERNDAAAEATRRWYAGEDQQPPPPTLAGRRPRRDPTPRAHRWQW